MQFISDFADGAEILPFVVVVWAAMTASGSGVVARRWVLVVGAVLLAILAFKAACFFVTARLGMAPISPSGHTASAGIVYGGLAWLGLRRAMSPLLAALVPFAIVALIGASRVAVGAHDWMEVFLGAGVALGGLLALVRLTDREARFQAWPVFMAALVVLPLMHGVRLPVEKELRFEILGD
jgi:membrane-associated phospholipid phosphatase